MSCKRGERGGGIVQCAVVVGSRATGASQPAPELVMSNKEHHEWIGDLMEELHVDDNAKHNDSDYSSDDEEECAKTLTEVECQLVKHFSVHPKFSGQFTFLVNNVHCTLCNCKLLRLMYNVYMHALKTQMKPTPHRGLAVGIRSMHGGKQSPW